MLPIYNHPFYTVLLVPSNYQNLPNIFQVNVSSERTYSQAFLTSEGNSRARNNRSQLACIQNISRSTQETPEAMIKTEQPQLIKQKKTFKKDKSCPAQECTRKYSSKIALRAHLRKKHPRWFVECSDYQP